MHGTQLQTGCDVAWDLVVCLPGCMLRIKQSQGSIC